MTSLSAAVVVPAYLATSQLYPSRKSEALQIWQRDKITIPRNSPGSLSLPNGCAAFGHRRPHGPGSSRSLKCFASALTPELKQTIDKVVRSNKVVLFMKGTKTFPQCGFSNTVVQILNSLNAPFETVDILENEMLRQGLKEYSSWPTFPQLYIGGDFFGGCDITVEAYHRGELQELIEKELCS